MIVRIEFEILDSESYDPSTATTPEVVHEELCKGLHENDPAALRWLVDHVLNVTLLPKEKP